MQTSNILFQNNGIRKLWFVIFGRPTYLVFAY
jgi:hypothetical protein